MTASYGSAMSNINSKTEARKKVREAQARANEAWQERQRLNVDDAASFLVELGRLAAVDEWERGRMGEIRAEGERRRHEHRQEGAAALSRMVDRGETLTAIAGLAGVKVSEVRAVLKSAGGQPIASPDAVGAASAVADAPESAHQVVRDDAVRRVSVGELPNVEGLRGVVVQLRRFSDSLGLMMMLMMIVMVFVVASIYFFC